MTDTSLLDDATKMILEEDWPCLNALRKYPVLLQYISDPTPEQRQAAAASDFFELEG